MLCSGDNCLPLLYASNSFFPFARIFNWESDKDFLANSDILFSETCLIQIPLWFLHTYFFSHNCSFLSFQENFATFLAYDRLTLFLPEMCDLWDPFRYFIVTTFLLLSNPFPSLYQDLLCPNPKLLLLKYIVTVYFPVFLLVPVLFDHNQTR